ncbi:hypothetical protein Hanom_Chr09g00775831 [Helianthus anomalus]
MFRIKMGFGPAQVSAQDGLRHETGFASERFYFELSFGPRQVLARGRFWIGASRFGSGSDRHGFPHETGFGSQRVLGRHEFPHGTISGRDEFRFVFVFCFGLVGFFGFESVSIFSFFCFVSVSVFCFRLVGFGFVRLSFVLIVFFLFRVGLILIFSAFLFRFSSVFFVSFWSVLILFWFRFGLLSILSAFLLHFGLVSIFSVFFFFFFFFFFFGSVFCFYLVVYSVSFRFGFEFLFRFDGFFSFVSDRFQSFQFFVSFRFFFSSIISLFFKKTIFNQPETRSDPDLFQPEPVPTRTKTNFFCNSLVLTHDPTRPVCHV